jgi:hypothetical protein
MLRRAAGLCLVGVVVFCAAGGRAVEPHTTQAPASPRVTENGPPPERQTDAEAADDKKEIQRPSVPAPDAEDSERAESREAKEWRAEEREQADLDAQRSMAESAREMLRPAWWQVGLAGIGGALLAVSIGLSALATKYAAIAASAAQEVQGRARLADLCQNRDHES